MTLFEGLKDSLIELANGDDETAPFAATTLDFVDQHEAAFVKALDRFGPHGRLLDDELLPASTYNDFYKWTMLPVMSAVEQARPAGKAVAPGSSQAVVCTFSANIRDLECRQLLLDSADGKDSPELYLALKAELESLAQRCFDRDLFERTVKDMNLPGWDTEVLDYVCGTAEDPRTLASAVRVAEIGSEDGAPELPENPHAVEIQVFKAPCQVLKGARRVYIEATGPWRRVTWLETTMMQAIYDVLFRRKNRMRYGASGLVSDAAWYPKWMATALTRCMRSCDAAKKSGLKGVLMTGRRTGGLAFMLCQNILLNKAFQYVDRLGLIGTSSVTAHYWLKNAGVSDEYVPRPAGTHAHELSMVMGAFLGDMDDKAGLPLSQVVAHSLYFYLSVPQGDALARGQMMPILPDTLGTKAFMTVASQLTIPVGNHEGDPFLSVVGTARQDSGTLQNFRQLMDEFDFQGALMASEVEVADDLSNAQYNGYAAFGAGGFFGDSEKAWDPEGKNISMAIKVLRVYVGGVRTRYSPVKTGDNAARKRDDGTSPKAGPGRSSWIWASQKKNDDVGSPKAGSGGDGKLEADGTLDADRWLELKDRTRGFVWAEQGVDKAQLQMLYNSAMEMLLPEPPEIPRKPETWADWLFMYIGPCCVPARGR